MKTVITLGSTLTLAALMGSAAFADTTGTVAFRMPDQASRRYEQHDFPGFQAEMASLCPACTVIYQNANADVALRQQFNAVITHGVREKGLGVIMTSHNMADARAVADRIVVPRLGRNSGIFTPDARSSLAMQKWCLPKDAPFAALDCSVLITVHALRLHSSVDRSVQSIPSLLR